MTKREHCTTGAIQRDLSVQECISLASYIVCEAASGHPSTEAASHAPRKGQVRMGRMQIILQAVGSQRDKSTAVGESMMAILETETSHHMQTAAWELLERLKLALPLQLAHITPSDRAGDKDGDVMVRQTSKLDKLVRHYPLALCPCQQYLVLCVLLSLEKYIAFAKFSKCVSPLIS